MDISRNIIMGTCPICHHVIRRAYSDKVHKVGYCSGCGLEWGNPGQNRYGVPKKVITNVELRRLVNEAYGQLSPHRPNLDVKLLMQVINHVTVRMTGYGIPDVSVHQLRAWGYEVNAGYIKRIESGERG